MSARVIQLIAAMAISSIIPAFGQCIGISRAHRRDAGLRTLPCGKEMSLRSRSTLPASLI
jgi:hypothetical protein